VRSQVLVSSSGLVALALLIGCSGGGGSGSSASTAAAVGSTTSAVPPGGSTTPTQIPREVGLEVSAASINVFQDPDAASPLVGQAAQGQAYVHLEQQGSWHKVQFSDVVGWCQQAGVAQSAAPVRQVTASTLNVRSGPGTTYRQLGQLQQGQFVVESQAQGDWREISYAGQLAWVHGAYLQGSGVTPPASRPVSSAGFIQLGASGDGFYSYALAGERWGLPQLIYGIERGGARWKRTGFPRAGVGHISLERGGPFAPHSSHRLGKNGDFRPVRTSGESPVTISQSAYSRSRTQQLIDIMKAETQARSVLFNDSGVSGVSYYSGHDNHFHLSIP
jgi:uncharacterized protein YgiM (DUF1202 family)